MTSPRTLEIDPARKAIAPTKKGVLILCSLHRMKRRILFGVCIANDYTSMSKIVGYQDDRSGIVIVRSISNRQMRAISTSTNTVAAWGWGFCNPNTTLLAPGPWRCRPWEAGRLRQTGGYPQGRPLVADGPLHGGYNEEMDRIGQIGTARLLCVAKLASAPEIRDFRGRPL